MSLKEAIPESLLEKDPELAKLADLLDYGLDGLKNYINSSSYKFDVMTMPMEEATRWLKAFGWKENWDVDKAKLLKAVILLYRLGGTDQGMKMAIENFTGIDVILIDEAWPKAYKAGLTLTDDEKRNVMVYLSYSPYKEQTLEFVPLAQQIADFMKPKHAHITAVVQRNRVQDVGHRTAGSLSGKTVLQVTYTPPELL